MADHTANPCLVACCIAVFSFTILFAIVAIVSWIREERRREERRREETRRWVFKFLCLQID